MHLKKFTALFLFVLILGMLVLSFKDILFISTAESQLARVDHYAPGKTEIFYKLGGSYEEKTLSPVISYAVEGKDFSYTTRYSCKDGCHKLGSSITIFYQKEMPSEVLVNSFSDFWKFKIYFLIFMGVLLLTSLPYLYYNANKQPSSELNG